MTGTVFQDINENGIQEEDEPGLAGREINISPAGLSLFTDDLGHYYVEISESTQIIEITPSDALPFPTSANPISVDLSVVDLLVFNFGFSNVIQIYDLDVNLYPDGNTFLCNANFKYDIAITNQGNATIDGVIELAYDSLFQGYNSITPVDSSNTDTVYMSFENLLPGQTEVFSIHLITPLVDFIGEDVTHYVNVYGYYLDEQVSIGSDSLTTEIACAYDPNDKQALPLGYTEEHWLLQETEQEFVIRFQNTGNAPAQDVRIQDTIDVNFDLSTIRLIANSHSVMTTINEETRVIDFFFEGIQLPDSVNNEPESHGLVSYAISPYAGLDIGTVLNNTALIYFDNNDAIVTNTTWTTIHACGGEAAFVVSSTEICAGETIDFTSTYEQVESHQWSVNSTPESTENNFNKTFDEAGEYIVQLEAENPLCNASSVQTITVFPIPTVTFTQVGDLLTSSEGAAYQWYLNGEEIEGATEQNYVITTDGTYNVEVTNENNCTAVSEGIMIVGVSEEDSNTILLYPNPMTDRAYLEFEVAATRAVRLVDSTGKEVRVYQSVNAERLEITKADLSAGNYSVTVQENNGNVYSFQIVVK